MANDDFSPQIHHCSFCGKNQNQVQRLVAGPNVFICSDCILLCQAILASDMPLTNEQGQTQLPSPAEMKRVLDDYVIGQEQAKRALCVAVYNH